MGELGAPGKDAAASSAGAAPPVDPIFARRRRIRSWLIVGALVAFTAFVYITAMVKMAAAHHLPHFM